MSSAAVDPVVALVALTRLGLDGADQVRRLAVALGVDVSGWDAEAEPADVAAAGLAAVAEPAAGAMPPVPATPSGAVADPAAGQRQVTAGDEEPPAATMPSRPARPLGSDGFFETRAEVFEPGEGWEDDGPAPGGIDLRSPVGQPPPPAPLLGSKAARAVLGAALRRPRPWGEVRVDAVVRRLAAGHPLDELPRRTVWSPSGPSRLVVDLGDAMVPFRPDVAVLRRQLGRLSAGASVVEVGYEIGPALSRLGRGTRVVALTDLGISRPLLRRLRLTPADWHRLAREVQSAGGSLVALVPFPRRRWPPGPASRRAVTYSEQLTRRPVEHAARKP